MNVFDSLRHDLNELFRLVRESERYCTSIAMKPDLATDEAHLKEVQRELRIAELSVRLGVSA